MNNAVCPGCASNAGRNGRLCLAVHQEQTPGKNARLNCFSRKKLPTGRVIPRKKLHDRVIIRRKNMHSVWRAFAVLYKIEISHKLNRTYYETLATSTASAMSRIVTRAESQRFDGALCPRDLPFHTWPYKKGSRCSDSRTPHSYWFTSCSRPTDAGTRQ